ncbi:uncharacterized protein LOC121417699 [Lytechinus variegatus]|uniref:uncharacterized protein LOC121417699 n=1 Tax=Lytechinus variegatus TaxID=7654 RepID=UPI001BB1A85E|nr:uncharacterized protein LOC121417699 [Lytechinus variegatus]
MQPVTIVEDNPQREGYAGNYSVGAVLCVSTMLLQYAIGLVVCGGVGYIAGAIPPSTMSTILYCQVCAFSLGGLYLFTSIIGFGTACRNMYMIVFFLITCILSMVGSLPVAGFSFYCTYCIVAPQTDLKQCYALCSTTANGTTTII